MGLSERSASSLDTVAGHAEHVYSVAEGATPPLGIRAVSSSWQRSAKKHGLDPLDSNAPRILTPSELKHLREPLDKLIFSAQDEMDELYKVVREAGYTVLLCDSSIVAVAPPEGGATGMLLAIDGNQHIIGANRVARASLMLDDRGLLAGTSLWSIFERDVDLFRRQDRGDISARLLIAGSNDSRPALVTPPGPTSASSNPTNCNLHTRPR